MKIVIVDDDCLVTEALKTILEVNEDVQVLATGSDGRDAVCLYAEYKPDVLLMDIRMKNMNGLEASAEILRADSKNRRGAHCAPLRGRSIALYLKVED